MGRTNTHHGETVDYKVTPEYTAYYGAKMRCTNPKHRNFHYYGGRGIQFRFKSLDEFLETFFIILSTDNSVKYGIVPSTINKDLRFLL